MKLIILAVLVVSGNCQSAFESFMSRNRDLFSNVAPSTQPLATQQTQPLAQWQQPQARSLAPSVSFASSSNAGEPFVTSNSHIQAFNSPQASGTPTTISGPNFQTSITLPALPPLPQHPPSSAASQQFQQSQPQPHQFQQPQAQQFQSQAQPQVQSQPQLTHQFSTHIHSHQASPASAVGSQFANQQASTNSFFNPQNNNGFPFNFGSQAAAPLSFPSAQSSSLSAPSRPLDFSSFQNGANFFTNQQQSQPQQSLFTPSTRSNSFPFGANAIRAPGFETFVFMQPSEQPVQGASLSKIIRSPNGIEKQMYYSPMPTNYSPPSVYSYSTVHSNPQPQQGQQQ